MLRLILLALCLITAAILITMLILLRRQKKLQKANPQTKIYGSQELIDNINYQLADYDLKQLTKKLPYLQQKTQAELVQQIHQGNLSYQDLVAYYLVQIKKDQGPQGSNAVSEVNPQAMAQAKELDLQANSLPKGLWYGMPILVKENINTNFLPTSAGSYCLKDFIPRTNAPVIDLLLEQQAIILGKTNLSEMSNWMNSTTPDGFSAKKGQTLSPFNPLVVNPYGSSTGSAVAIATDLAVATLGTETAGSIVAPACANSVIGYKPSRGYTANTGVLPISSHLDTVGCLARSVPDAANLTKAISSLQSLELPSWNPNALKGKTLGLMVMPGTSPEFIEQVTALLQKLEVQVKTLEFNPLEKIDIFHILFNDFNQDVTKYLQEYQAPVSSLAELVAYNQQNPQTCMPYGQNLLEMSLAYDKHNQELVQDIITKAQTTLAELTQEHQVDAWIMRGQDCVILPAVAGSPEVAIPLGITQDKAPVGLTFFGKPGEDALILNLSHSFYEQTQYRVLP